MIGKVGSVLVAVEQSSCATDQSVNVFNRDVEYERILPRYIFRVSSL